MPVPVIIFKKPLSRELQKRLRFQLRTFDFTQYDSMVFTITPPMTVSKLNELIITQIKYRTFRYKRYYIKGKVYPCFVEEEK